METTTTRPGITVAVLLAVESAFALLAVLAHHAFTAEYGNVTDTALKGLVWGLTAGLSGVALIPVVVVGVIALIVARLRWMRLMAIAIPFLMLLGMLAVTPLALRQKIEVQLDSTPQCVSIDSSDPEAAEAAAAEIESQRIFDSIEHIGYFSGGGESGVGGCDRLFVISEDIDVLQHYRSVLPSTGWDVIEDDGRRLRAQRDGLAFEVMLCSGGGVVWAGKTADSFGRQCNF
jgi:hypothetical protein